MQVYDVEVGGVSQRMTAEAAERERHQFALVKGAVGIGEFRSGSVPERKESSFGDAGVALGYFERVAAPVDQLDAERKPPFVDQSPDPVERHVIAVTLHRSRQQCTEFFGRWRHGEAGGIEQAFE